MTTQTDGAIGYVEYAYAKQNKMAYAQLINKDGKAVAPNAESFQAAAAQCRLGACARLLPDPHRPAGRGQLADHRRELHPGVRHAAGRRPRPARRSSSSTGRTRTVARWRPSWTTCRCRTALIEQVRATWKTADQGHVDRRGAGTSGAAAEHAPAVREPAAARACGRPPVAVTGLAARTVAGDEHSGCDRSAARGRAAAAREGVPRRHARRGTAGAAAARRRRRLAPASAPGRRFAHFRLALPHARDLEPGHRQVRRAGAGLRHAGDLAHRDAARRSRSASASPSSSPSSRPRGSSGRSASRSSCWRRCRASSTASGACSSWRRSCSGTCSRG